MKKILLAAVCAALVLTGCSNKRSIDPEATGSVPFHGTSWKIFCDGPNGVIWIPSWNDSDPDELEAYVYDHPHCTDGAATPTSRPADEDGILEDE